jgi:hypothetical protein
MQKQIWFQDYKIKTNAKLRISALWDITLVDR